MQQRLSSKLANLEDQPIIAPMFQSSISVSRIPSDDKDNKTCPRVAKTSPLPPSINLPFSVSKANGANEATIPASKESQAAVIKCDRLHTELINNDVPNQAPSPTG